MHANRESTNKSPIKLNPMEIKLTRWFVDKWRKPLVRKKPPPNEFKFITPKNPLINNQAITSMRNLTTTLAYPNIPTYHWTFAWMPNWSWYCSSLLSFVAKISNLWLTTKTWMIVVGRKIFHFINNEDQEALNYKKGVQMQ